MKVDLNYYSIFFILNEKVATTVSLGELYKLKHDDLSVKVMSVMSIIIY